MTHLLKKAYLAIVFMASSIPRSLYPMDAAKNTPLIPYKYKRYDYSSFYTITNQEETHHEASLILYA